MRRRVLYFLLAAAVCARGQEDVALVPFEISSDGQVQTTLERVGSGPGWLDEVFQLCLDCTDLSLNFDPGLRSSTALETPPDSKVFQDVLYWKSTYSIQKFNLNTTLGNSILALAQDSDIFAQFAWFELCPRTRLLALHKSGSPDDAALHVCGFGGTPLFRANCTSLVEPGCVFQNYQLGFFDASQETHECTGLLARSGGDLQSGYTFVPTTARAPVLDSTINLYEKQWYATYDGSQVTLFEEHAPRHTHSWQTFLVLEMHLIFYTHFIADAHKDVRVTWTRFPLLFGSLFSACTAVQIHLDFAIDQRLYNIDTFFRGWSTATDYVFFAATLFCAVVSFTLALLQFSSPSGSNKQFYKFYMTVAYEMALCLPLTLVFMGGGRYNLLNLFFLFTVTLVTFGTRVRDFVRVGKNFRKLYGQDFAFLPRQVLSLLFLVAISLLYAFLIVPGVWRTAMSQLFVLASVANTATVSFVVVFTLLVARYTAEHETYWELEKDQSTDFRAPIDTSVPTHVGIFNMGKAGDSTLRKRTTAPTPPRGENGSFSFY